MSKYGPGVRQIRDRIAVVFLLVGLLGGALFLRLAYLQLWQHDDLAAQALGQRFRAETVAPDRGTVYDRNFNTLALSIYSDAVYANPEAIRNRSDVAETLAPLLRLPVAEVNRKLNLDAPGVLMQVKVDPTAAEQIRNLRLPGITVVQRPQRYYPQGTLAAQLLGFAGIDNQGLEGLEYYHDNLLRGISGRHLVERDPRGRAIPRGREELVPSAPGYDLILNVDNVLQYLAEQELAKALSATGANWGTIIASRPQTGEILAMAIAPTFDPNDFANYPGPYRNLAVTDQFEPGSTFKILTAAMALEEGIVTPETLVHGPPTVQVGGGRVTCWRYPQGFGEQTFVEALANSCNTAFARVGSEMLDGPTFARYLDAFGFGKPLGIDLPGETGGIVPIPGRIAGETLRWANVSFGQGLAVTPVQLLMAVGAVANGGYLMQPQVVSEVRDKLGRTISRNEPVVLRQVISNQTSTQLRRALQVAVEEGTGSLAQVPGYIVAGKTGTAEIPTVGGYGDGRVASFVGFTPVEDPEIALLVVLYDVQSDPPWGGELAAPVFSAVAERALSYLGSPRMATSRTAPAPSPSSQLPSPPMQPRQAAAEGETVTVPDVRGHSMRAAVDVLEETGLRIRIMGSGNAVEQSPDPGTTAETGTVVRVHFEPPQ